VLGVAAAGVVALAALAGCASSSGTSGDASGTGVANFGDCEITSEENSISIDPVVAGTLTVATTLPAPGWWNGTTPASIRDGYEYCMAANLAHAAGLSSVTVQNVSFDSLVAGQTRGFDIALAESSITDERKKAVNFSTPYFDSDQGVLVEKGADITASNIRSKTCAVFSGSSAVDFVKGELSCQEVKVYPDVQSLYQSLLSGQVDAVFLDTGIVLAEAKESGGKLEVVGQYKTGEQYGAIYPKGSGNVQALDRGIQALVDDGTLAALSQAYLGPSFGGDPAAVSVWEVE
jgi:polar amino acid transport system substrate-binding protein